MLKDFKNIPNQKMRNREFSEFYFVVGFFKIHSNFYLLFTTEILYHIILAATHLIIKYFKAKKRPKLSSKKKSYFIHLQFK